MCGRYASATRPDDLAALLGVPDRTDGALAEPDFNVAPTKPVPAVLVRPEGPELTALRWGLVPSWAKDPKIGARMINARVETAATLPAFRAAWARRRCLLPADGYYEWMPLPAGELPLGEAPGLPPKRRPAGPRKQPYFVRPVDGGLLLMAGLYELWRDAEGQWLRTCTILTTDAPDSLGRIHDRAPMTVPAADREAWLDPAGPPPDGLLQPAVDGVFHAVPVSSRVNDVRNNGPELIEPVAA